MQSGISRLPTPAVGCDSDQRRSPGVNTGTSTLALRKAVENDLHFADV